MRLRQMITEGTFNRFALEKVILNVSRLLQNQLGVYLDRVGGAGRVYEVSGSEGAYGAIFIIKGTNKAISLVWEPHSSSALRITTIELWREFSFEQVPDYTIELPNGINFVQMMDTVVKVIKSPKPGDYDIMAPQQPVQEMATRTSIPEFAKLALSKYGSNKIDNLSWTDIKNLADEHDVQVPTAIRLDKQFKKSPHVWSLAGAIEGGAPDTGMSDFARQTGAQVAEPEMQDPDVANLARVRSLSRIASKGKLHVMGRNSSGHFYKVPNIDEVIAQLERILERQKELGGDRSMNMEEQYEDLQEKIRLVAGEEARYIRSLLITGMPSSGKSYTIMKTLSEMGLEEGDDYVVYKGKVTTFALWRALVENVNKMLVFDDCDSIWDDANAVNILKAALDTGDVREITYNVGRTINTAAMTRAEREEVVNKIALKLQGKWVEPEEEPSDDDDDEFDDESHSFERPRRGRPKKKDEPKEKGDTSGIALPNKIDFKGKIIFISNLDESELDDAVKTRAFLVNMNFTSTEMLDFIDKIKSKIKHSISEDQKQEVLDYLRELYTTGRLRRQINFRLVQQAFDLRTTTNWQRLIASL